MKKVLVIAAHSDDEALGCAGTILKHVKNKDEVRVIFVADGVSARVNVSKGAEQKRSKASDRAMKKLGVKKSYSLNMPDNKLDSVALLEIVQKIEPVIADFKPEIIYTHHPSDLNVDHMLTYKAVATATRPYPGLSVKEIYTFEVVSSTDWNPKLLGNTFAPNVFVDISKFLSKKLEVLKEYEMEMRPYPHSRSYENVANLAKVRGASVGLEAAEAFCLERKLY